ncbi:MAG: Beta-lactamase [Candidatus Gottesmanbacteria bacterium GW2011_GWC2_39_8]|uniref:Beta-lactamase n=1 Tax=Candidatus Gottesmanbacteria bacterium GW2011_GWC2_39_8 TaxID=1618450 RepID=A0A0G0Q2B5_9BACT|nr:MAG: Beta-lactamase [Candidatus Gottesmanbacteria bacterium GW2011_GWC2_39_8]
MKIRKVVLVITVPFVIAVFYSGFNKIIKRNSGESDFLSPIADELTPTSHPVFSVVKETVSSGDLKIVIEEALEGTKGKYGVVIKNFQTGEEYYANEHRKYEPASLYKLWIMATTFKQIQKGVLKENDILSEDIPVLNSKFHIDPTLAEQKEGKITMTVKDALEKMITISDNYSALLLSEKLRLSNVSDFLKENNFTESRLGEPPISTPYDFAFFFEKLYNGELANEENTQKMLKILEKQTFNGKIPKYLPDNVTIAHKTGEIGFFTHDAGIVFSDKGNYVIVVMSESDSPFGAEERISNISKAVYEYFYK